MKLLLLFVKSGLLDVESSPDTKALSTGEAGEQEEVALLKDDFWGVENTESFSINLSPLDVIHVRQTNKGDRDKTLNILLMPRCIK